MRCFFASVGRAVALVGIVGCGSEDHSGTGDGEGGAPPTTSSEQSSGSGLGGASATTSTLSSGGEGGASATTSTLSSGGEGGGSLACTPGADEPCYTGPPGTEGQGLCVAGTHTCNQDGTAFGPCEGEVVPVAETCNTPEDDDCDGDTNEEGDGCVCIPNGVVSCYTGPPATEGVGACSAGLATCNGDGTVQGACMGEVLPSNESCAATLDLNCDGSVAPTCTGDHVWSKQIGGPDGEVPVDMAVDAANDLVITGRFYSSVNFGGGNLASWGSADIFVMKLGSAGDHQWSKRFGDTNHDTPTTLALDPTGNVFVAGHFNGTVSFGGTSLTASGADGFLVKLDTVGNHLWSKQFSGNSPEFIRDLAVDPSGNVIAVGSFTGTLDVGNGNMTCPDVEEDGFIVKLDAAGNHLWSKHIYSVGDQMADVVTTDAAGNVFVAGRLFSQSFDFGGGFVYGGGFVVKYDALGNHVWSKAIPALVTGIAVDSSGNSYLAGDFSGSLDFGGGFLTSAGGRDIYVLKLDGSGNHVWSKRFGASDDQLAPGFALDSNDNIVLHGELRTSIDFGGGSLVSAGGRDIFLAKLDTDGNHLWSKRFGDHMAQRGLVVARSSTDQLFITGDFLGNLSFGGATLACWDTYSDMYVAKFTP